MIEIRDMEAIAESDVKKVKGFKDTDGKWKLKIIYINDSGDRATFTKNYNNDKQAVVDVYEKIVHGISGRSGPADVKIF